MEIRSEQVDLQEALDEKGSPAFHSFQVQLVKDTSCNAEHKMETNRRYSYVAVCYGLDAPNLKVLCL